MNFLYAIVIFPIEQIIEVVYTLIYKVFKTPGISVIGVSFAFTFLTLPLYIIAEKWQKAEHQIIKKLKPKADKIKQVFKGDEQYMLLSTYYRQNGYHPIYSLRNSLSILIQIPFFIAAYHFLSHFQALERASFLFITDLSKPDALLNIGGLSINILPVLMTAINCTSGFIYTQKLELRDKIQIYALALIFLVLLYNSPSALVLYWTTNNFLSLVKNLFYKLKNPLKVLYIIISACAVLFIIYLLFINGGAIKKRIVLSFFCLLLPFIPVFLKLYFKIQNYFFVPLLEDDKKRLFLFLSLCAVLTVLIGLSIPSSVIASSPDEFSFIDEYKSPLIFVFITFFKSAGLFFFWPLFIYFLFGRKIKCFLTFLFWTVATNALFNTFTFSGNFSTITNTFTFDLLTALNNAKAMYIFSFLFTLAIITAFLFLIKYKRIKIIGISFFLILFSLTVVSAGDIFKINREFTYYAANKKTNLSDISLIEPIFHLSKDKPNIIIIMSDRAIGGFVKPIFDEHPQLYNQFDGFTWFPNTVSFNGFTLMGVPPIWGGYEYTPEEMNKKDSIPLVEKHNEALMVIPKILSETGYQVTVTDPSYANYRWTSDVSVFDKYKENNITTLNTIGRYTDLWCLQHGFYSVPSAGNTINRNTLWFSFLKISPPFIRKIVYDDGRYWRTDVRLILNYNLRNFLASYAVLDFLPELTKYDSEKPSALLITNEATHEPMFLQYPSYTPVITVTDKGDDIFSNDIHYHANSALYLQIGEWFEELKKNNVYDNTRIIIVSDHGRDINAMIADTELNIPGVRRELYNPVLLFKDFNSNGKIRTDMSFMTNADVPVLALDSVAKTINPFSGKSLRENTKSKGIFICSSYLWEIEKHNKTTFNINSDQWLFVHDNIFNPNNWEKVEK